MENSPDTSTLKRKANVGRILALERGMTSAKAFRLCFSKSAEEQLNIAAVVLDIAEHKVSLPEIQKMVGDEMLLLQLDGPNNSRGVAAIDRQLLTGLIEAQTIGYVTNKKATDRQPTKTDGVMCETFLDFAFYEFTQMMHDVADVDWGSDYQTGAYIESARLLGLIFKDVPYILNKIDIDLSEGAKQGTIFLVFPEKTNTPIMEGETLPTDSQTRWTATLQQTVGFSRVHLNAVLHRTHLSLEKITKLQVNDLIDVPKSAISELHLEGVKGQCITLAKLGQQDGCRAARIRTTIEHTNGMAAIPAHKNNGSMGLAPLDAPAPHPIDNFPQSAPTETATPTPDISTLPMVPITGDLVDIPPPLVDLAVENSAESEKLEDAPMAAMPMA